jgi:hypothetical protein
MVINDIKVFVGLSIISKKTISFNGKDIRNNEEFDVIGFDKQHVTISNDRLKEVMILHADLKLFDMAYCLTVNKAQGSTYDFEYSIYEYQHSHPNDYIPLFHELQQRAT